MAKEKDTKAGNLEKELQEIMGLESEEGNVVLSITAGFTDFLTIICC